MTVHPDEVRLRPTLDDRYGWSYLPESAHLFMKQLSKHNITQYKQLCRELGRTFEAVLVEGASSETRTLGIVPVFLSPMQPILILIDQIWNEKKMGVQQHRTQQ